MFQYDAATELAFVLARRRYPYAGVALRDGYNMAQPDRLVALCTCTDTQHCVYHWANYIVELADELAPHQVQAVYRGTHGTMTWYEDKWWFQAPHQGLKDITYDKPQLLVY